MGLRELVLLVFGDIRRGLVQISQTPQGFGTEERRNPQDLLLSRCLLLVGSLRGKTPSWKSDIKVIFFSPFWDDFFPIGMKLEVFPIWVYLDNSWFLPSEPSFSIFVLFFVLMVTLPLLLKYWNFPINS